MDVTGLVELLGGAARRAELLRRVDRAALTAALRAGRIVRRSRGVYALPAVSDDVVLAVASGGVLSCSSAAGYHGFDLLRKPDRPHITVPRAYGRVAEQVGRQAVIHRATVPADQRLTTTTRTLADCARCLPPGEALVVIDSGLRKGVRLEEIAVHLKGPGSARANWLLGRADGRSGSVPETMARVAMTTGGVADIEPQAHIEGVGWVDFLIADFLVVEIDGFAHHSNRADYRNDRRRANSLAAAGYALLRFTYEDVMSRPEHMVKVIKDLIALHKRTQL